MLPLPSLFSKLCLDPSDAGLQSRFLMLQERNDPELRRYLSHEDATCRQALTALFARPSIPVRRLSRLAAAQVRTRHRLDEDSPIDGALLAALADDSLCLLLLSESLNTDITLERVFTRLRRACLHALPVVPAVLPLLAALALQAWNNEYIWDETAAETAEVEALTTGLAAVIQGDDFTAATLPLLRWAMYRPLAALPGADALVARPLAAIPPVLRSLWQRTLLAPSEEAALRAALPTFEPITDATSRAVQAHYDENPYPRWVRLSGGMKPVLAYNRSYDSRFAWPATFRDPLQILVAGCGTGEHGLTVARANPHDEVLALDVSAASLAYAQRMARELGIDNIRFLQADLLHLPALGRQFHHIECVGVLQHVRDQQAAWQSLTAALYRGGTLSVGVIGKLGWLPVTHLRARVARERVLSTPEAVRAFRARLRSEPKSAAILARLPYDFFSLSMLRVLLFRSHEHEYTLTELEQRAAAGGLRLLGYRLPRCLGRKIALPAGPATFAQWRTLEMAYTGSIAIFFCTLYRPAGTC
jgi:SAM-dependent methyltransferase